MGFIGSMKVVTDAEKRVQPGLVQAGNHKWVIVIQSICWVCNPTIHYLQKAHPHLCMVQGGSYTVPLEVVGFRERLDQQHAWS
jgi:hypothetical protein